MRSYDRDKKFIVMDDITREFLGSLRELRIMYRFSCRYVGKSIGMSERYSMDYILGRRIPTIKTLMDLAEFFGADLSGSLNYQYWHGQIDFSELRRELSEYRLSYTRLSYITGYSKRVIECTVNDRKTGSLKCLSAVIEILNRARNGEILPCFVKQDIRGRRYKHSCPDEITIEFLRSLKSLRISMGLSQAKLARMIGRNTRAIYCYESGRFMPPVNILIKLAEILGYDLSGSINSKYANRKINLATVMNGLVRNGLTLTETGQITKYDVSTIHSAVNGRKHISLQVLSDVIDVIDQEEEAYRKGHEIPPDKRKRRKSPCQK